MMKKLWLSLKILYLLPVLFLVGCTSKAIPTASPVPPTPIPSPLPTDTPIPTTTPTITPTHEPLYLSHCHSGSQGIQPAVAGSLHALVSSPADKWFLGLALDNEPLHPRIGRRNRTS